MLHGTIVTDIVALSPFGFRLFYFFLFCNLLRLKWMKNKEEKRKKTKTVRDSYLREYIHGSVYGCWLFANVYLFPWWFKLFFFGVCLLMPIFVFSFDCSCSKKKMFIHFMFMSLFLSLFLFFHFLNSNHTRRLDLCKTNEANRCNFGNQRILPMSSL